MINLKDFKYKVGDKVKFHGKTAVIVALGYTCISDLDIVPSYTVATPCGSISITERTIEGYATEETLKSTGKIKKLSYGDFCGKNIDWDGAFLSNSKIFTDVLMPKINEIIDKMNERED